MVEILHPNEISPNHGDISEATTSTSAGTPTLRLPFWYPVFAEHTLLTSFVKLQSEEVALLAAGKSKGKELKRVFNALRLSMPGGLFENYFVTTDSCSPTDTERFYAKRGAVHSVESAWRYLAESEKIRAAAAAGKVEYLCVRPFVHIDRTREFRLFVFEGELKAMSQYNLIRHFRRLEGIKQELWDRVAKWFECDIAWRLGKSTLVMDIFLDGDERPVIIDLNVWGAPTNPLLLNRWDRDWKNECAGIVLMAPPTRISGDIEVSF